MINDWSQRSQCCAFFLVYSTVCSFWNIDQMGKQTMNIDHNDPLQNIINDYSMIQMKARTPTKLSPPGSSNEDKLKIIIRIRPVLNEQDPLMFVNLQDNDTLQIRRPGNHSYMKFNNILPPESTQKDVFCLVEDSIRQFLKGINTTIFAYGQTGAGKTYSIIGNYSPNESQENLFNFLSSKERGVLSRSLEMIMNIASKEPSARFYVSFYQIYNEKIYDLYNYTNVGLDIRQSKNGEISIPDLITVQVSKMQQAIQFLMVGLKNRATGSTQANAKSSRSHSIFQICMEKHEGDDIICSSLRIVDLAGSQKFKIPSDLTPLQKQIRIQQLTSINGSLSCLGHCISALIDKSRTHIPFRNSKLTRILSDSLLGQGKMRFIICISPSLTASAQTFSTLQFANRAKRAIFDRVDNKSPSMQKKKSQSEQMTSLKKDLQRQRQLRALAEKELLQMKKLNEQLKLQNSKLMSKVQNPNAVSRSTTKSQEKQSNIISKITYYDQNKENDFKEEMLKLTIFQKNRLNQLNSPSPTNNNPSPQNISTVNPSQVSHNPTKAVPINKRKAEFEKKIKKFIESDSPHRPTNSKKMPSQYSFEHDTFQTQFNNNQQQQRQGKELYTEADIEQNQEQIWDSRKDDSNQFIQKACTKMNMPEFQQLKFEMERARQELLNLRKKDSELQQRKLGIR